MGVRYNDNFTGDWYMGNLFLGIETLPEFCDLDGVDILRLKMLQKLEGIIEKYSNLLSGEVSLLQVAVWDRLLEVLLHSDFDLYRYICEDNDKFLITNPMKPVQSAYSFDSTNLHDFIGRISCGVFDAHVSVNLVGCDARLIYRHGKFEQARLVLRVSSGRDITEQLGIFLSKNNLIDLDDLSGLNYFEVRGKLVLPLGDEGGTVDFHGGDVGTDCVRFVGYELVGEGLNFPSKDDEYNFLEELGFEVPLFWLIENLDRDSLMEDLREIVVDCFNELESGVSVENRYKYKTDGLIFSINDKSLFNDLRGNNFGYNLGSILLKIGTWGSEYHMGYIQTIFYRNEKTKVVPIAIIAKDLDVIEFTDLGDHAYISDLSLIESDSWGMLGVFVSHDKCIKCVPLYEPSNILILDAYPGRELFFRYDDLLGVVPCFSDGTPLVDGLVRQILDGTIEEGKDLVK